jgi:hypothetical protein
MIQEVILFDSEKLDPISGYNANGKIDLKETIQRTGLVAIINKTVRHLYKLNLWKSEQIINLKTEDDTFSFKLTAKMIISVRGTSEKENEDMINKIVDSQILGFF